MYIVSSTETYDSPFANMSRIKNPELDKTLLAAAATTDRAKQQSLYDKAQQLIAENAYWVPMYPEQTLLGISKKLKIKTKLFKETKFSLLYDMLYRQHVPATQAVVFRVGYNF